MKIKSNEGIAGGEVVDLMASNDGKTTVWVVSHPAMEGDYQPKPVQIRMLMSSSMVSDLSIVKGASILAKVEIVNTTASGRNNSKVNITNYVVTDILSYSNGGECCANEFLLGGTIGKVETKENSAWQNVSLALQKSNDAPTQWVRISVHNKFVAKAFKNGLNKGDSLFIKAKLVTHVYDDRNGNRVVGNDYKIDRVFSHEAKYAGQNTQNQGPYKQQHTLNGNIPPQSNIPPMYDENMMPGLTDGYDISPSDMLPDIPTS